MRADPKIYMPLIVAGVGGLILSGLQLLACPAWAWLALVAGGLAYPVAWRAAGVKRVSSAERRRHARRLRNAERREKRHMKATLRVDRRMKQVLAEVRERPTLEWGERVAAVVRKLQEGMATHEVALKQNKLLTDDTAERLNTALTHMEPE